MKDLIEFVEGLSSLGDSDSSVKHGKYEYYSEQYLDFYLDVFSVPTSVKDALRKDGQYRYRTDETELDLNRELFLSMEALYTYIYSYSNFISFELMKVLLSLSENNFLGELCYENDDVMSYFDDSSRLLFDFEDVCQYFEIEIEQERKKLQNMIFNEYADEYSEYMDEYREFIDVVALGMLIIGNLNENENLKKCRNMMLKDFPKNLNELLTAVTKYYKK